MGTTPTSKPSATPSSTPTSKPSATPSFIPTDSLAPTDVPSLTPITAPSTSPSISPLPTEFPTDSMIPSSFPSDNPTPSVPTERPTKSPTKEPSVFPSLLPTAGPSISPQPSSIPSQFPSFELFCVVLTIQFDFFVEEISWKVTAENGETMASKDYFTELDPPPLFSFTSEDLGCFEGGQCYIFSILDSGGDGLSNGDRNYDYNLFVNEEEVADTDPDFGFEKDHNIGPYCT